jgi:hypothetical protein
VLDWPLPANVICAYTEFRCRTNGQSLEAGSGLLGALVYFGLPAGDADDKKSSRSVAVRGGPWSAAERAELLSYCGRDVHGLVQLWNVMSSQIDVPRALLRGQYMEAVARMEYTGIPIDREILDDLRAGWDSIRHELINRIDSQYGVFEDSSFRANRFARYLAAQRIPWPRTESGALQLDQDAFRDQAKAYPQLYPLYELRHSLSQLRLNDLAVGRDSRNRTLLSPFRASTSRNQPSNSRSIFGPSTWIRSLIHPEAGTALAYVDWESAEYGIGAALSGDSNMLAAYRSGDPYIDFARRAGAVPRDATKESHGAIRKIYKTAALAVMYGQEAESLADRLGRPVAETREILRTHRREFSVFWRWSDGALDVAHTRLELWTRFGWRIGVDANANPRSLRNFGVQGNCAEMLRLACISTIKYGVSICFPVHDALLIEAPVDEIETAVAITQRCMADASAAVLDGFRLRSDSRIVRHPDRYADERGAEMWRTVTDLLATTTPSRLDRI